MYIGKTLLSVISLLFCSLVSNATIQVVPNCNTNFRSSVINVNEVGTKSDAEDIVFANGVYDDERQTITWTGVSCKIVQNQGIGTAPKKTYLREPRWYKYNIIEFANLKGYQITSVDITCTNDKYADALLNSIYSSGVSTFKYLQTVTITPQGDFTIEMGAIAYIKSISIKYTKVSNVVLTTSLASLDFGKNEINSASTKTFVLSASNLTSDLSLSITGADSAKFKVSPTVLPQVEGKVTTAEVAVSYLPTEIGEHFANLVIDYGDGFSKNIPLSGKSAARHTVTWMVNGEQYSLGDPTINVLDGDKVNRLPQTPSSIGSNTFVGWTTEPISTPTVISPSILFSTPEASPVIQSDATYYAVFCSKEGAEVWKKTDMRNIAEGVGYILTPSCFAFTGKIASGKGVLTSEAFAFNETGTTTTVPNGACPITIRLAADSKGYTLYNSNYGYLVANDNKSGNLAWATKADSYWVLSDNVLSYAENDAYLLCYTSAKGDQNINTYSKTGYSELSIAMKTNSGFYATTVSQTPTPIYTAHPLNFVAKNQFGYWATFSHPQTTFFTEDILTAAVVVEDCELKTNSVAFGSLSTISVDGKTLFGYYLPANTGVLLCSQVADATYYVVANHDASLPFSANMLLPAPKDGGTFEAVEDYAYYKLAYGDYTQQSGLGFYLGASDGGAFNVRANSAYLAVPISEAKDAKSFLLAGSTSSKVEDVKSARTANHSIFNFAGIRQEKIIKPGLYLVGGKKRVVR